MAFFEVAYTRFASLATGLFKPVAGLGTGAAYPSPSCKVSGGNYMETVPLHVDGSGNVLVRGPVMTDEQSFYDDFIGTALANPLTGTLTFTGGSNAVSGSGTAFLTELDGVQGAYYIKLNSAGEEYWSLVSIVNSDTSLVLAENYEGSTGSGASAASLWRTIAGAHATITVANSDCIISAGTTSGEATWVFREADYSPMMAQIMGRVSNRRANQEIVAGLVDDPSSPSAYALVVLDGTDASVLKFRTASNAASVHVEETTHSFPNGATSATNWRFEISVIEGRAVLAVNGLMISEHLLHVPNVYQPLCAGFGVVNTGTPAGATTFSVNSGYLKNSNRLEVCNNYRGEALPVRIQEDAYSLFGILTTTAKTADQVVAQYTVPTGKFLFVVGYCISSGDVATRANPIKVGKGALTETTNTVNGLILRSQVMLARESVNETFATPLYLAASGEIVKIAVTPDATTSTVWRASLDFILR